MKKNEKNKTNPTLNRRAFSIEKKNPKIET
jgi:hypothetical protein